MNSMPLLAKKQAGNVLLVSLALMLIMTIWGVSSVRNTTQLLRASGNSYMGKISFDAAEFAASQVGNLLVNQVQSPQNIAAMFTGNNGRFSLAIDSANRVDLARPAEGRFDYNDASEWDTGRSDMSFIEVEFIEQVTKQPLAIIEYLGRTKPNKGSEPDGRYAFRVTAIGWGVDGLASTVVRVHYALDI